MKTPSSQKVALVTGGSRGIGAATCMQLAKAGYAVVVNYTASQTSSNKLCQSIALAGGTALGLQADVSNEAQVLAMFAAIDSQFGRLDALINNAGVVDVAARVDEMSLTRLRRMFDINVLGSIICAREAVKRMSTRHAGKGGVIVNISSAAARIGSPGQYVDYAASKGAIDTLTIGLAKEVATEGIRVNGVRPGIIDTDIHASGGIPDRVAKSASSIPMQRGGSADEVANAIVWLLSDSASYVTGTTIDVTGGR